MPREKSFLSTIVVLLYTLLCHSCQQPRLNAREDEVAQIAPREQTPQAKPDTEATKTHKMSDVVLTSSSDASPDARHTDPATPDHGDLTQSVANLSQSGTLASISANTTMTEASSRELSRKRPATTQASESKEQLAAAKQAKKETSSSLHKEWFTSFANTTKKITQDTEDEEAWDHMDKLLDEGAENKFLTASITCPNDNNSATEYEYTPLHYAAETGLLALVKELVELGKVPVDIQTQDNKSTPLHLAASRGQLDVVQFLVDQGANPNLTDSEGGSALHYAAAGRRGEMNRDVIEYLVSKGANFLKSAKNHSLPLSAAVLASNLSVIEYWEDNYTNNPDLAVDTLTNRALKLAKYRSKHIPQERSIQADIIRSLTSVLKARSKKIGKLMSLNSTTRLRALRVLLLFWLSSITTVYGIEVRGLDIKQITEPLYSPVTIHSIISANYLDDLLEHFHNPGVPNCNVTVSLVEADSNNPESGSELTNTDLESIEGDETENKQSEKPHLTHFSLNTPPTESD